MTYQKKYLWRAKIVAYLLQLAPFVKMIGLNGSLSRGEAKETSDIDFLIITQKNRIWTCRMFVILITQLTGLRLHGHKTAGRICLNRYQVDNFLDILPHNEYHARVFSRLVPLVDIDNTYSKYLIVNSWMAKLKYPLKINKRHLVKNNFLLLLQKINERIFNYDFLENHLKSYQVKKIKKYLKRVESIPKGRVRISDKEIFYHLLK